MLIRRLPSWKVNSLCYLFMNLARIILNALVSVMLMSVVACGSSDGVLSVERMAQLMADMHTAESVQEFNRVEYNTDSARMVLKQSVYARHGVTAAQVDTSFMWYGHHIDQYIEMYDRVAEILKERMDAIDEDMVDVAKSVVGDSADAWNSVRTRVFDMRYPENYLTFVIDRDDTWNSGDVYEWKFKLFNTREQLDWTMAVDYENGLVETVTGESSGEGWQTLTLPLDSTRSAVRVYGFAALPLAPRDHVYLDSISLVRTRVERAGYWNKRRNVKSLDLSVK